MQSIIQLLLNIIAAVNPLVKKIAYNPLNICSNIWDICSNEG